MARKQGQPIHGWINLDKPTGISSAKAVAIVRRVFDAKKAGHGGTLDPLASGVLPIALGEATKTVSFAMSQQKSYEFELAWGVETSTDDCEGVVTRQSNHRPDAAAVDTALESIKVILIRCHHFIRRLKLMGSGPMTWHVIQKKSSVTRCAANLYRILSPAVLKRTRTVLYLW